MNILLINWNKYIFYPIEMISVYKNSNKIITKANFNHLFIISKAIYFEDYFT